VAEFVSSGKRRSEFCQSRGLSFSTLDRHLKKLRWKRRRKPISSAGRWCRWSWRPRNRRRSRNRVVGWPWYCRSGAGSRCILILIRVRSNVSWASWSGRKPCLDSAQPHGSIWPRESLTCARASRGCTVSSASMAGMSRSTLHHHFRGLTAMSPLQFQKQLRLRTARQKMLTEELDAASAAFAVGYESPSQFNREYKRFFGKPPMRDVQALRASL